MKKKISNLLTPIIIFIIYILLLVSLGLSNKKDNINIVSAGIAENRELQNTINSVLEEDYKQKPYLNSVIQSGEYYQYITNTLQEISNNSNFNFISSRTRFQGIEIDIQSKERLSYSDYDMQSKEFVNKLYEQIQYKTIKKDGWLSNDDYIINLNFYERFNDNINPKRKRAIQVGIYQIHTEDLEKYREYDKCVNGGISELEWQQERK